MAELLSMNHYRAPRMVRWTIEKPSILFRFARVVQALLAVI